MYSIFVPFYKVDPIHRGDKPFSVLVALDDIGHLSVLLCSSFFVTVPDGGVTPISVFLRVYLVHPDKKLESRVPDHETRSPS